MLMELLQGAEFDDLFRRFERTAFRLESQDAYQTLEESGPFGLFRWLPRHLTGDLELTTDDYQELT